MTDSPDSIATAMGLTVIKFADFWKSHSGEFDVVFCLGDRYEMFAAVTAAIPFNIKFAHIHGGETTLGAIDNIFRHSITLASKLHFASTEAHADRVAEITQIRDGVYNVGALSLDNLSQLKLLSIQEFKEKWDVDLTKATILTTFHPETVDLNVNLQNTANLVAVIKSLPQYQFLITMPNADTAGNTIRRTFTEELSDQDNIFLIENLGSQSYFTALKYVSFLLGNTSSGIIEAASFGKYVINLGNRQLGRTSGDNVLHVPIEIPEILAAVKKIETEPASEIINIYYKGGAAEEIIRILKKNIYA
jgi:GDP/UDP-N,N'-diacetylbacillosamine 2-epimerase (hydrolysing)